MNKGRRGGGLMEKVQIKTEYIKLDQLLKWCGVTDSGAEAKDLVVSGKVKVNGQTELQRGKKMRSGDVMEVGGKQYTIE